MSWLVSTFCKWWLSDLFNKLTFILASLFWMKRSFHSDTRYVPLREVTFHYLLFPQHSEPPTQHQPSAVTRGHPQGLSSLGERDSSTLQADSLSWHQKRQRGAGYYSAVCLWISWRHVSLWWWRRVPGSRILPGSRHWRRHTLWHGWTVDTQPAGRNRCHRIDFSEASFPTNINPLMPLNILKLFSRIRLIVILRSTHCPLYVLCLQALTCSWLRFMSWVMRWV